MINEPIKKSKINKQIKFIPKLNELNDFLHNIKKFGNIVYNNFSFKKCPLNISENRKFEIIGENENIITKTGSDNYMGTICENQLDPSKEEHIWKVKILNISGYYIMVGVATLDFDFNSASL